VKCLCRREATNPRGGDVKAVMNENDIKITM